MSKYNKLLFISHILISFCNALQFSHVNFACFDGVAYVFIVYTMCLKMHQL